MTAIQTVTRRCACTGVDVRLVAPDYARPCADDEGGGLRACPGVRSPAIPRIGWCAGRMALGTVEAVVEQGCDLIHVQTPFVAHYAGCATAKRYGVPVIATYHTLFEEYLKHYAPLLPASLLRGLARRFSRRQCNALDAVIVPSRAIEQRLGEYGVTTPMHIPPTGIVLSTPAEGGREAFRECHGIDPARPVALFVGRVAHEKNIDYLLDVAYLARAWVPDIPACRQGEGPALPSLRRLVAERGLATQSSSSATSNASTSCRLATQQRTCSFASRTGDAGTGAARGDGRRLARRLARRNGQLSTSSASGAGAVVLKTPHKPALAVADLLRDPARRHALSADGRAYASEWSDTASPAAWPSFTATSSVPTPAGKCPTSASPPGARYAHSRLFITA